MPRFYLFLSLAFSSSAAFGQGPQVAPLTPVQPKLQLPKADSIVVTIAPYRQIRLYCGGGRLIRNEEVEPKYWLLQPLLTAIPGIQVTPHSGAPGDWAAVRIRGGSTLAGTDQPLYVVDGVPALNNDFVPDAAPGSGYRIGQGPVPQLAGPNPLLFLPVEDIEQITVLTGALGTARYGAQGSNGVLLITTKRGGMAGQKKPLRVRYAGLGGVQQVRQRYELLDARQYAELANEAWTNAPTHYQPKPYSPAALAALGPGTDWQAEIMRDAFVQSHHLALDGSSARTRYLLSTDFLDQAGVVRGSGLRRYQLRLNLDHRASDKLRLHLSASAAQLAQTLPGASAVARALLAAPTVPARNPDGSYYQSGAYYQYPQPVTFFNPLAVALDAGSESRGRRLLVTAGAEYQLRPSLLLGLTLSQEQSGTDALSRELTFDNAPTAPPVPRTQATDTTHVGVTVAELHLEYERTLATDHTLRLSGLLGIQRFRRSQAGIQYGVNGPNSYYYQALRSAAELYYASVLAAYSYQERYEAQVSLRADHYGQAEVLQSVAAEAISWLPGAELRWHAHKEAFFPSNPVLSTATFWAGAGQAGVLDPNAYIIGQAMQPLRPRTTQLEAGLRLGLFTDKLWVNFTAYRRSTAHIVLEQTVQLPPISGLGSYVLQREARLRNEGLLLSVDGRWHLGKLDGSSHLAATWQQQQVTDITEVPGADPVPGLVVGENPHPYRLPERLLVSPVGTLYPNGQSAAGRIRFRDLDGDGILTANDATYQGTALPTSLLSLTQELHWGRLSLDARFDGMFGYQLLNTTLAQLELPTGNTNGSTALLDRWTPDQYNAYFPQANPAFVPPGYDNTHARIADHLRLSQLTLSCQLLPEASPHQLSVWLGAQNLFVLTSYDGFDPNVSSGGSATLSAGYDTNRYPVPRTWLAGVRASF